MNSLGFGRESAMERGAARELCTSQHDKLWLQQDIRKTRKGGSKEKRRE